MTLILSEQPTIIYYWEERNREHFVRIAAMPPKLGQEALRAKLKAWKERIASLA